MDFVFLSINRYERKKNLGLAIKAFGQALRTWQFIPSFNNDCYSLRFIEIFPRRRKNSSDYGWNSFSCLLDILFYVNCTIMFAGWRIRLSTCWKCRALRRIAKTYVIFATWWLCYIPSVAEWWNENLFVEELPYIVVHARQGAFRYRPLGSHVLSTSCHRRQQWRTAGNSGGPPNWLPMSSDSGRFCWKDEISLRQPKSSNQNGRTGQTTRNWALFLQFF